MPKHTIFSRKVTKPSTPAIHPMWRGIGCVFMAVIPVLSFVAANILIKSASTINWIVIPPEMILPNYSDPFILIRILYTAVVSLVLFFIISLTTFILNSIMNPKRKGPYDV
jgi:hypothetical protein